MALAGAVGGAMEAVVDEQKPSLFELLSEQQLHGLLPPTLRYLLTVATQRYPRYLLRALNSFDELYALAMLVVEHYYLRTLGGTFTEHFYGLKRERVLAGGGSGGSGSGGSGIEIPRAAAGTPGAVRALLALSPPEGSMGASASLASPLWRNLAVVVGVPYLKRKLDEAYERDAPRARLGAAYQRLPAHPTLRDRARHAARWFLRNVYPSVHAAYGFAVLVFHLGYLFDATRFASPLLWLVGTRVRRMTGADYQAIDVAEKAAAAAAAAKARSQTSGGGGGRFAAAGARLLGGLSLALPASIFALKFLEWWHASDFARQLSSRAAAHLDLPTPVVTGLPVPGGATAAAAAAAAAATAAQKSAASGAGATTGAAGRKGILKKESSFFPGAGDDNNNNNDGGGNGNGDGDDEEARAARAAPIAQSSLKPILTVAAPADSALCPICGEAITTPTACQTGVVYCYICIHKWVAGQHERQEAFLEADAARAGRWESGEGRCAVTGRRVLGGTEGLRRLMV